VVTGPERAEVYRREAKAVRLPWELGSRNLTGMGRLAKKPTMSRWSTIYYQTGNKTLAQLLDFPNAETDTPEVANEKQRRLLGN